MMPHCSNITRAPNTREEGREGENENEKNLFWKLLSGITPNISVFDTINQFPQAKSYRDSVRRDSFFIRMPIIHQLEWCLTVVALLFRKQSRFSFSSSQFRVDMVFTLLTTTTTTTTISWKRFFHLFIFSFALLTHPRLFDVDTQKLNS